MNATLPLTPNQERVWRFIRSCKRSPTYDEMAAALGYKNRGHLNRLIVALRERGYVTYRPYRPRTLVALDPREDPSLKDASIEQLMSELVRRGVMLEYVP